MGGVAGDERIEIDGHPATVAELGGLAFSGYSHFTSMQVRDRRVRGLGLHLDRLVSNSAELFGRAVDPERVRACLRHALDGGPAGRSGQVSVFATDDDGLIAGRPVEPHVMVRTGPPVHPPEGGVRVRTAEHERFLPHLKHAGTIGLVHHWRAARRDGFDDALLTDRDGFISEGTLWNVAFADADAIVWPSAPALPGITMQLVQAGLVRHRIPSVTRPVHITELGGFRAAVLMNSIVPARAIVAIDDHGYGEDAALLGTLRGCHDSNEPEPV
jgi:branched-subunit amino acid aminotransferase/4-amino-4-deoxychorismate lyase